MSSVLQELRCNDVGGLNNVMGREDEEALPEVRSFPMGPILMQDLSIDWNLSDTLNFVVEVVWVSAAVETKTKFGT